MPNTGFSGLLQKQTGTAIVDEFVFDSAGQPLNSGSGTIKIKEVQQDGTLKTLEWAAGGTQYAFVTSPTTPTGALANQGDGVWTFSLATVANFTVKAKYLLIANLPGADAPYQRRKVMYGGAEGDLIVTSIGTGQGVLEADAKTIAAGAIGLSQYSNDAKRFHFREIAFVGVTTTIVTADVYLVAGTYNGATYYQSTTLGTIVYLWTNGTNYIASTVLGTAGAAYFQSASNKVNDTWAALGTAGGTTVVTAHGHQQLAASQFDQLCLAGATVTANLVSILGSALAGTGSLIAAAFNTFFNINSPTGTANRIPLVDTTTGLTNAGPDTTGTTMLLARITAARAGYLDNLNVGGVVASHADILAINQSASKHLLLVTVGQYEGGEAYVIEMRTFASLDGSAVNADSTPTITATGTISGSLAVNLSAVSNPTTGVYRATYTTPASPTLEQIRIDGVAVIATASFSLSAYTQTVALPTAVFTATDKTNLTAIYSKLPANNMADETVLLAAIGTPAQASQIPSHFNNATFSADGVFAATALANTPVSGGGGGDVSPASIAAIASATATALGGSIITIQGNFSPDGSELCLVTGDDYAVSNSNPLKLPIANNAAAVGTKAHLRFNGFSSDAAVSPTITSPTQDVIFSDVLKAFTSTLPVGALGYQIRFINASGLTMTQIQGNADINQGF